MSQPSEIFRARSSARGTLVYSNITLIRSLSFPSTDRDARSAIYYRFNRSSSAAARMDRLLPFTLQPSSAFQVDLSDITDSSSRDATYTSLVFTAGWHTSDVSVVVFLPETRILSGVRTLINTSNPPGRSHRVPVPTSRVRQTTLGTYPGRRTGA